MDQFPSNLFPIVGTLLGTIIVAYLTQWGSSRLEERRAKGAREQKEIDVVNQREGREIEFATTLRNELKAQIRDQQALIQQLNAQEDECVRKQLRAMQWLWRLQEALRALGSDVELPADLTLEGFERPVLKPTVGPADGSAAAPPMGHRPVDLGPDVGPSEGVAH